MEEAEEMLKKAIWKIGLCFHGKAVQEIRHQTTIVAIQAANTIRSLRFFATDLTMTEFLDEMCWATSECAISAQEFTWFVAATYFSWFQALL